MIVAIILTLLLGSATARFAYAPIGELKASITPATRGRRLGAVGQTDSSANGNANGFPLYTATLDVPVDHFHNESKYEPHSNATFQLRYHYDSRFYKPGGPVIVLQSGEVQSIARIPYLQKGIINILAQATNGLGVILEHRYYGASIPVSDFSTQNMRFLTTEQAMADTAYFAKNVKFNGANITENINPPKTPWIIYGGSYAGAFAAFTRVQYPDLFWGAIASSAVTNAIWDYWHYYEPIRDYGPPDCINTLEGIIDLVDQILMKAPYNIKLILKKIFGLDDIDHDDDFANTLTFGVGTWQQRNWDPAINDNSFENFCTNVTSDDFAYPANATQLSQLFSDVLNLTEITGVPGSLKKATLNFAGYIRQVAYKKAAGAASNIKDYYGNHNAAFYDVSVLPAAAWRAWPWQYCTEWGFLQTGSGVPYDRKPLISRLLTTNYTGMVCKNAFGRTEPADVSTVNKYGGPNISYSRLAFVDGEWDPWRWATPHAESATPRKSTPENPFILISKGVHHWDENGALPGEAPPPPSVTEAQKTLLGALQIWLEDFKTQPAEAITAAENSPSSSFIPTNGGNSPGDPPANWQNYYSLANPGSGGNASTYIGTIGIAASIGTQGDTDAGSHNDVVQAGLPTQGPGDNIEDISNIDQNPNTQQTSDKRHLARLLRKRASRSTRNWSSRIARKWRARRNQSP